MLIATALKHMLAAGLPHDQIVAAVAEMEAARPLDPQAERRRARDRERKRLRKSAEGAEILPPLSPTPPNPTNLDPPSPPKGGSSPRGDARSGRRPRAKTRVPEDWSPRAEDLAMAAEEGLTPGEIERELARMRDWQFRYGRVDWDAAFRTWIRKAIDLRPRHDHRPDPATAKLAARQANFQRAVSGFETVAGRLPER